MTSSRSAWMWAAGCCALLAIVHTWPLASAPATWSRNDNGDAMLNEWILAWVQHQLPRAPARLFQGNIFYPARDTLAFSEPLVVPAILGAPIAWLGGSPVLVFNLLVIAGFALTALAGYALVVRWTGDRAAGLLAGSLVAFNSHTLTRLPHVQAMHLYGLPLALLAADRLVERGWIRDGLWLAGWMTVLAYTSGYLFVFGSVTVGIVLLTRIPDWQRHAGRVAASLLAAVAVTAVAVLPEVLPYLRVAREQHMVRPFEEVAGYSASLTGYLAAAGTVHFSTWSGRFFADPIDPFFPGAAALALAGVAVVVAVRARDHRAMRRRVLMLSILAVAGLVLSLGPRTPVYGWLYRVFPPMQGLRAAARFGNLFLLGVAALAGIGLAAARSRTAGRRWAARLGIAAVAVANVEALRAPLHYTRFGGIPQVYAMVRDAPGPVVLVEVPFYPPLAIFQNAEYVLNSTAHWRPLMNGYSGYLPASYLDYVDAFRIFPDPPAIAAMRGARVTHVMVHLERYERNADEILQKSGTRPELELLAAGRGGLRLYRLR